MTDTNYVAVPRELSDSVLERVGPINDYDGTQADADHRDWWATVLAEVAAPPAASGRARELVWDDFSDHVSESKSMPRYRVQSYDGKWVVRLSEPFTEFGLFDSRDAAKAEAQWRWDAYVRSLLAPVDERAASSEAAVAFDAERFERAPCYLCGYNGRGYYQPETHPCAAKYHAHPAPTTADAGVTEAMVETFEAKFLECARTRPDSTLRDDIRAALVAALGARKGE